MKNLPNIEKSVFSSGEYVGYARSNVWIIHRHYRDYGRGYSAPKWVAYVSGFSLTLYANTLREMSELLRKQDQEGA